MSQTCGIDDIDTANLIVWFLRRAAGPLNLYCVVAVHMHACWHAGRCRLQLCEIGTGVGMPTQQVLMLLLVLMRVWWLLLQASRARPVGGSIFRKTLASWASGRHNNPRQSSVISTLTFLVSMWHGIITLLTVNCPNRAHSFGHERPDDQGEITFCSALPCMRRWHGHAHGHRA